MTDKNTACVKWFNPRSGFGFVTDIKSNEDVFVHHSELVAPENVYRTLTTGEYISYSTTQDGEGKVTATDVTGVGGGPLLCESAAKNAEERRSRHRDNGHDGHDGRGHGGGGRGYGGGDRRGGDRRGGGGGGRGRGGDRRGGGGRGAPREEPVVSTEE